MLIDCSGNKEERLTTPVFLDIEQVAKKLHRTPGALRNLVMRRKIPFRKAGGRLMFIENEIEKWIQESPGLTLEQWKKGER